MRGGIQRLLRSVDKSSSRPGWLKVVHLNVTAGARPAHGASCTAASSATAAKHALVIAREPAMVTVGIDESGDRTIDVT